MVTRVRVEAEGSTIQEVEDGLTAAFEALHCESVGRKRLATMFGEADERGSYPGLVDAQAGEFVIERFARDCRDEHGVAQPGHGGMVYRGRMTAHFARPSKTRKAR